MKLAKGGVKLLANDTIESKCSLHTGHEGITLLHSNRHEKQKVSKSRLKRGGTNESTNQGVQGRCTFPGISGK